MKKHIPVRAKYEEVPQDQSEIPSLWNCEEDSPFRYSYSQASIQVRIRPAGANAGQVDESEKIHKRKENKWEVVVRGEVPETRYGEKEGSKQEAKDLAIEFMDEFDGKYDGDAKKATMKVIQKR